MTSSQFIFSIYLLTFALSLQTIFGASPLFHFCLSSAGNFTTNDPYGSNLKTLLGNLHYQTPPQGFGNSSVGSNSYQTYGLALCRGDVNATACETCVNKASNELHKRRPYNKGAIIWYDNCLLKYLNTDFFHQIDNQNKSFTWNVKNVSNPTTFNNKTKELLSKLAKEASVSPKLYEVGELELSESNKLYGLVQCTRDLSNSECFTCPDTAIGELHFYSDGKEGGRVVGGSCNIRYEIYPFVMY
ncbi:hypothetical protein SO802_029686 [Lithocarpus litseifolius]|uniref:Gnk2-homologous domain-containing protein n=1 Tax=Lithocarpus litseifolius TaxID=425828 RepID=A0AAW2BWD8_9ROSI